MKPKLAVFCSGFGSNFQAIISAARAGKIPASVALMICDKPGAYAVRRAARHGIPVAVVSPKLFASRVDYEKFIVRLLKSQGIDLVVLAGFMRILSPYFVRAYSDRIVNIHPSYLPAFKGAHAIRDAYEARVPRTGVTVHLVNEQVDAGRILLQKHVRIGRRESLAALEKRIHKLEHTLYPQAIRLYLKKIKNRRKLRRA